MKYLLLLAFFFYIRQVSTTFSNDIEFSEKLKCSSISEQVVNRCLQPILTYATSIQGKTDFKKCTKSVNCHSISIEAVEASYGYMCGAGFKKFEEHASCFAEVENQPEYVVCKDAASQSMDDALKLKKNDMDAYFHRLCGIMDSYLRCCRPFVNDKCGSEAWQLVSQITMDSLHVTMPTCDVNAALR